MRKENLQMRHDLNSIYNLAQAGERASHEALKRSWLLLKKNYTEEELVEQGLKETYSWCDYNMYSCHFRVTPPISERSMKKHVTPAPDAGDAEATITSPRQCEEPTLASASTPPASDASATAPPSTASPAGTKDD